MKKQQFQLVEKVVAGVDRAARQNKDVEARRRVRAVALEVLAEASERALARDLRNTWAARDGVEVDLGFADTGDLAVLDAAARRAKYVQWDEVLPAVPDLIDDATRLDAGPVGRRTAGLRRRVVRQGGRRALGSRRRRAPSSSTCRGSARRARAARRCGAPSGAPLLGFGCSQDLARLRATPAAAPWVDADQGHDLQTALTQKRGGPGLAAAAKAYLGKALDKSQQCSDWDARPLSEAQRAYAALDAVAVLLIHEKLRSVDDAIEKLRRIPPR